MKKPVTPPSFLVLLRRCAPRNDNLRRCAPRNDNLRRSSCFVATLAMTFFLLSLSLSAGESEQFMEKGNQAYNAGHYEQAADYYKKVTTLGYRSSALFYNMGNAYFKLNDLPNAILWYERARRIDPGNEEIDYNLKVANNRISDKIDPLPELFYIRWYRSVVTSLPADAWAWATIALFVTSLLFATLYIGSRIMMIRKTGFWGGLTGLTASVILLLLTWSSHRYLSSRDEAIVFSPVVTVKSSPGEQAIDLFVIHEGTKVVLRDRIGDWYEIRIANGSVGWVPSGSVEQI